MLEPYDPDRILVILIHGLTSIPQMWVPTISSIESDPELRGRYQFWVFAYPTGDPILLSALKLRKSLAQVYELYSKTKDMVLISHSMVAANRGAKPFVLMRNKRSKSSSVTSTTGY
ncbi:MAG TPA: hypothetical protein VGH07_07740 [Chthoniobacterales bacterium]